jgi:hypothetical protein
MRAFLWAVAFSRLLDRRRIKSFDSRDLNTRNTRSFFPLLSEARLTLELTGELSTSKLKGHLMANPVE